MGMDEAFTDRKLGALIRMQREKGDIHRRDTPKSVQFVNRHGITMIEFDALEIEISVGWHAFEQMVKNVKAYQEQV